MSDDQPQANASADPPGVDALIAALLTLVSGGLYVATCAPSVLFGDGGEFQFVPYIPGIAHPTGYPLYVLLGWAWSHLLPLGDVAYRMNLFSVFWAALAVGGTYLLARRVIRVAVPNLTPAAARLASAATGLTFAVGTTFWSQAVIAEVYSLNAFFVVVVLLLWLRFVEAPVGPRLRGDDVRMRGPGYGLALAVVYGLSLAHHRTMLLLLPALVLHGWIAGRAGRMQLPRPREAALMVAGVLLPLALYAYLPLRAPYVPYATLTLSEQQLLVLYDKSLRGLLDHVTAAVFAGNVRLGPGEMGTAGGWLSRLAMAGDLLRSQVGLAGIALALVGLVRLVTTRTWGMLALTGVGYLAGVLFNLTYAIGDVAVLFIPSYLFVSLWVAVGLAALAEAVMWIGRRLVVPPRHLALGVLALGLLLPASLGAGNWTGVDQSANRAAEGMWQPILARPVPEGAVLVTNDRDEMMPLWYYQYVEGRRTDLLGLFPGIVVDPAYGDLGGVVDAALASGRPAYLIKPMPGLEVKARLDPAPDLAPLVRLAGPVAGVTSAHPLDAQLGGDLRLTGYDLAPARPLPGEEITVTLYWQPLGHVPVDYTSFVHLVDGDGATLAQSDHRPGGVYYPTSLWKPGEDLRDAHTLTLPEQAPVEGLRMRVGMYVYPSMESPGPAVEVELR